MDDLALLRMEMETLWVTDRAGALLHCRTAGAEPPPLLAVGSGAFGVTCATSVDVPPDLGARLAALLDGERPADAVADRTAFYSTCWNNAASQRLARRLGLGPLDQWWQLSRA